MHHSRKSFKTGALFVLLYLLTWSATSAQAQIDPVAIENHLQQLRNITGAPGISLAVAINGEMVYSGGVGYAELENHTPADGKTVHNVASVSKVMATVAVMQLVEEGRVGLDDVIQRYIPTFPEKTKPVTLRRILTHTSGIRHYKNGEFGPHGLREMRRFTDIEEAMKHFSDDPLIYEPGEYWRYFPWSSRGACPHLCQR